RRARRATASLRPLVASRAAPPRRPVALGPAGGGGLAKTARSARAHRRCADGLVRLRAPDAQSGPRSRRRLGQRRAGTGDRTLAPALPRGGPRQARHRNRRRYDLLVEPDPLG